MTLIPLDQMQRRLDADRQDSDVALFFALLYYGECVVKLITTALVAAIQDREFRYRQEYHLVRADGLGDWHSVLVETVNGPPSQYLVTSVLAHRNEINRRCGSGTWQYEAVAKLSEIIRQIGKNSPPSSRKQSCLEWVETFVKLRNKTRAHGARPSSQLADYCHLLEQSIGLVVDHFPLFKSPWAYLRRNLSGKYRVTGLGGEQEVFQPLKSSKSLSLANGVYVYYDEPTCLRLISSNAEASDFFFPNGAFSNTTYEVISYYTGETQHLDAAPFQRPTQTYPGSETEGLDNLPVVGHSFTNIPPARSEYIERKKLEQNLKDQLLRDQHPIVSLTGLGGIGKTSLALQVTHELVRDEKPRFEIVLWFSARDIDLSLVGPQPVTPRGVNLKDFSKQCVQLLSPREKSEKGFDSIQYFADQLGHSEYGPTLFIFDNFETVENPGELYTWIDSFIRPPNKVLITTRIRNSFKADFPVRVDGMTREECEQLISTMSRTLRIDEIVTVEYRENVISESEGHPYVIKVLLGEVARKQSQGKVERIIAGRDDILTALFERTYAALTPAAQKTFMTLASWRSMVPEIALIAVMLRPANERIPIESVIDELLQSSLVQSIKSESGDMFLHVPLSATLFAKRKLFASPWKPSVESDADLLREFGASQRSSVARGVAPTIDRFFKNIAKLISAGKYSLEELAPTLKYVCDQYKESWLMLADLYKEEGDSDIADHIKYCLQRYLEAASGAESSELSWTWKRLADICRDSDDVNGELHAIGEMVSIPGLQLNVITAAAGRINGRLAELSAVKRGEVSSDVKNRSLQVLTQQLEVRISELDATGCSRLAWLYLHRGKNDEARRTAERGLSLDAHNYHCARLLERLG